MPPIKIALYQGKSDSGVEVNVALKERVMAQASAESADLIVFCETSLHGYCSGPVLLSEAEMQYGTTFQRISQLAAQLKVCFSLVA